MPDSAAYLERIRQSAAGKDPLAAQEATPARIAELIAAVPEAELKARPQPGKWSVVEIVAHLAEDELVTSWRYRQMLENPGCSLAGFDQDIWAALGRYGDWSSQDALAMFTLLRQANLRLLHHLSEEEWTRFGVHAERGRITIRDLAQHMAGHDANHLEQILRLIAKQAQ